MAQKIDIKTVNEADNIDSADNKIDGGDEDSDDDDADEPDLR